MQYRKLGGVDFAPSALGFGAMRLPVVTGEAGSAAPPRIDEGHNIFLPDAPDGPLARGLPADVHRFMQAQFDAHPPQNPM